MPIPRKTLPEAQLIATLKAKNPKGAEAMYDMYAKCLYGVIIKIVRHTEMAEDTLQKSFLQIWNSFDSYDSSKSRLFTWMLTLTRNIAINTLRSKDYRNYIRTEPLEKHTDYLEEFSPIVLNIDKIGVGQWLNKLTKNIRRF
jgi:RNA polymerase sigma factor (sigma-70 family)